MESDHRRDSYERRTRLLGVHVESRKRASQDQRKNDRNPPAEPEPPV
jgi:hypothetical protein